MRYSSWISRSFLRLMCTLRVANLWPTWTLSVADTVVADMVVGLVADMIYSRWCSPYCSQWNKQDWLSIKGRSPANNTLFAPVSMTFTRWSTNELHVNIPKICLCTIVPGQSMRNLQPDQDTQTRCCRCDLDLDQMTLMYELHPKFWRCTCVPKMNCPGQSFRSFQK